MSFVEKLMFFDLTVMLDKCIEATSPAKRDTILKKYFKRVLDLQQQYKIEYPCNDHSLYPLIRIILSTEEHQRAYGIQEKTLRKILINSLNIIGSSDAKKVEHCNEDEIADAVYEVVKTRSSRTSTLNLQQIDALLNYLCENQKQQCQQNQFEYLFLNGSASDFKWIVKIILKKMKLKVLVSKLLLNYHPLAPQLYTKFHHLSQVCKIIDSGRAEEEIKDKVEPFIPIRPMLSQKFSNDMNNMIGTAEFYQEIKLDGERFQMHMENDVYKYYSRNGHDFSECFNILLSPLVKYKTVVHSLILDGEMIIWNRSKQRFVTKGETEMDVKKINDPNSNLRPCYCAFDVLYVNGVSYIDQPFNRRCEILSSIFDDQVGVMIKTEPIKIRDVDHLVSLFNTAMQNEEEGIILKNSVSKYMPGERDKSGWYKVKADYFDGELVKEFDCVIVGGKYQNPHKKDYLLKYSVGAVEKLQDGSFKVYTIGEINHGLSRENRKKLNDKLVPYMRDYDNENKVEFEKGQVYFGKTRPDVFIPPHKSIVLQIKASELAPSSDHYFKYTFRFPRISEVRYDKFWDDSVSLKEFQEFFKSDNSGNNDRRVRKITKRNAHKDDIVSPTKKSKLATSRSAMEMFCHDSQEDDIEPIDNVLEGKEFCVLTTSSSQPSVHDLKVLLRLHGASLTEFPRKSKTFAVIAGEITQRIKIYIKDYNIIKAEWVTEQLSKDFRLYDFPDLRPSHFHYINESMKESFKDRFDHYGDSYTEAFKSPEDLKEFLLQMDEINGADEDLKDFENELYDENIKNPNFFRGFSAFFYEDENHPNDLMCCAKILFKYRAGRVSSKINGQQYIFIDKSEFKKDHEEFKNQKLVNINYIYDSNDAGKLLDIEDYVI
ncbi:hypothetical protein ACKWTF_001674 [Chironomus riparius]